MKGLKKLKGNYILRVSFYERGGVTDSDELGADVVDMTCCASSRIIAP